MFFGAAWGYLQLLKLSAAPGQPGALPAGGGSLLSNSTALLALSVLVVTAVLAGVVAIVRRISPLAAGLPGLLLLAWTALYLTNVRQAVSLIPLRSDAFGAGWEALLFNGVLGAVGAVMVFPLFIPSRWRLTARAGRTGRAASDAITRNVNDYLTPVKTAEVVPDVPEVPDVSTPPLSRDDVFDDDELVGTVISNPAATRPVDTSHVTGASRALRNTGSFKISTGAQQAAGGYRSPSEGGPLPLRRPYAK